MMQVVYTTRVAMPEHAINQLLPPREQVFTSQVDEQRRQPRSSCTSARKAMAISTVGSWFAADAVALLHLP